MIFVLRQIQKKCREHNVGLYADFVDLNKDFDTISLDGLWKFLALLCCPSPPLPRKFLTILLQLYEGHQGQVKHNGSLSGSFPISSGVKQEYVLTPTLFSIFCNIMLLEEKKKKKKKRTCQTASTSVSEQTAVSSTVGVSSHARKPSRSS